MTQKPRALLVYAPPLNRDLVTPQLRARLEGMCELLVDEAVPNFDDPRAALVLGDVEILVTGWGCPALDAKALDALPRLRAAFHAAGTVKNHVAPECFERGVRITSAAFANAIPVAEFTVATILLANKQAFALQRRYRERRAFRLWSAEYPGLGNHGKCIGIVGASRIGRMVIEHLRAFGFEILVHDPFLDEAGAATLGAELCTLDDLFTRSDVVSLHAPALPETQHLVDARSLSLLRDGAILINTARGALVDHTALTHELVSGRISAVLDTTEPEVLAEDSPLYDLDNVFLTPHIAGSQGTETARMFASALDELERFIAGEPLQHEVRLDDLSRIA